MTKDGVSDGQTAKFLPKSKNRYLCTVKMEFEKGKITKGVKRKSEKQ